MGRDSIYGFLYNNAIFLFIGYFMVFGIITAIVAELLDKRFDNN